MLAMGLTNDSTGVDQTRFFDVELFDAGGSEVARDAIRQADLVIVPRLVGADDILGEFLFGVAPVELTIIPGML